MINHAQYISQNPLPAMIVDFRALIANLIKSVAAYEADRTAAAKERTERFANLNGGNDKHRALRASQTAKVTDLLKTSPPMSARNIADACEISRGSIGGFVERLRTNGTIRNVGSKTRPLWELK